MAERIGQALGDVVQLNCIVDRICWDSEAVRIRCRDGRVLEADAVVVTLSLGVLKASARYTDRSYRTGVGVLSRHLQSDLLRRPPASDSQSSQGQRNRSNQLFYA